MLVVDWPKTRHSLKTCPIYPPGYKLELGKYSTSRRHLCVRQLFALVATRSPGLVVDSTSKRLSLDTQQSSFAPATSNFLASF